MVNGLPVKSKVKKASGRSKACSNEDKTVIVALYDTLGSYRAVAERVGRNESCIRKIMQKFRATGSLERVKGAGRKRITTATDDHKILMDMLRNRGITAQEILDQNSQIRCSTRTIRNRIKENGEKKFDKGSV